MKWSQGFWIPVVASLVMIFTFTACQKKVEDNKNLNAMRGNVNTDGLSVLSSSNLNGRPLSISITNIVKISDPVLNSVNSNNKSITSIDFNINGLTQRVQVYNSMYGEGFKSQLYMSGFVVYYETRCVLNTNCNEMIVNSYVGDQNSALNTTGGTQLGTTISNAQWKQIAILKTFSNNAISAVFEIQAINAGLQSTDQALQTLYVIRANP